MQGRGCRHREPPAEAPGSPLREGHHRPPNCPRADASQVHQPVRGQAPLDHQAATDLALAFLACLVCAALPPAVYAGRLAARAQPVAAAWGGRTRGARRATGLLIALEVPPPRPPRARSSRAPRE